MLDALLESAEAMLAKICNRLGWTSASATLKAPGIDHSSLCLVRAPVSAITSVKLYYSSSSSETLDSDTYRLNDDADTLLLDSCRGYGRLGLGLLGYMPETVGDLALIEPSGTPNRITSYPYTEVIYTGGYANQAAVPEDLVYAANEVTKLMFLSRDQDTTMQSESHGNYSYTRGNKPSQQSIRTAAEDLVRDFIRYPVGVHS